MRSRIAFKVGPKAVDAQASSFVEELGILNEQAFQTALSVYKDPSSRARWAEKAHAVEKRILDIAGELGRVAPAEHRRWAHRISESVLDLNYVAADSGITSLRVGDVIEWQ